MKEKRCIIIIYKSIFVINEHVIFICNILTLKYFKTKLSSGIESSWSKPISICGTTAILEQIQPKNTIITNARTHFFNNNGTYTILKSLYKIPFTTSSPLSFFEPCTKQHTSSLLF